MLTHFIHFIQGGNPYEKLKIGGFRKPKVGDIIYLKPNAVELFNDMTRNIPYGESESFKNWKKTLYSLDITKPYIVKRADNESTNICIEISKNHLFEIDNFYVIIKNI